ncbi:cytochrome c-type biogenesis protein CcmH, partial [Sinorhizobium meliloti]
MRAENRAHFSSSRSGSCQMIR